MPVDRIVSRLARHDDHNANVAISGRLAERFSRVFLKKRQPGIEFGKCLLDRTS
jgi:hypothetical protein